jgi:hypothetical protein
MQCTVNSALYNTIVYSALLRHGTLLGVLNDEVVNSALFGALVVLGQVNYIPSVFRCSGTVHYIVHYNHK